MFEYIFQVKNLRKVSHHHTNIGPNYHSTIQIFKFQSITLQYKCKSLTKHSWFPSLTDVLCYTSTSAVQYTDIDFYLPCKAGARELGVVQNMDCTVLTISHREVKVGLGRSWFPLSLYYLKGLCPVLQHAGSGA